MKIEIELAGFTPVLDNLIQEYNLVTAAIYGIVWRYSQMEDKVCKASLKKIGKRLDLSEKTAERHVKKLCTDGYLVDLTPNIRNKPHGYAVTGKAELTGVIAARSARESERGPSESRSEVRQRVGVGPSESPLKIHSKIDNEDINGFAKKSQTSQYTDTQRNALNKLAPIFAKQCQGQFSKDRLKAYIELGYQMAQETCPLNIVGASLKSLEDLARAALVVEDYSNQDETLKAFKLWWHNEHWAGKKGQAPTPAQVGDTWGQFEADKVGPTNGVASNGPTLTKEQKARLAELTAESK